MITKCNLLANTLFYQTIKRYKEIVIFHNEERKFNVLKIYMSPLVIKLFLLNTKFIIYLIDI